MFLFGPSCLSWMNNRFYFFICHLSLTCLHSSLFFRLVSMKYIVAIIVALLVAVVTSQPIPPSPGYPYCNVCGPGRRVTIAGGIVTPPSPDSPVTCAKFQLAGQKGFIQAKYCSILVSVGLLAKCGCAAPTPTRRPTRRTTRRPTYRS